MSEDGRFAVPEAELERTEARHGRREVRSDSAKSTHAEGRALLAADPLGFALPAVGAP